MAEPYSNNGLSAIMPIYKYNGKILVRDGKIAVAERCCCECQDACYDGRCCFSKDALIKGLLNASGGSYLNKYPPYRVPAYPAPTNPDCGPWGSGVPDNIEYAGSISLNNWPYSAKPIPSTNGCGFEYNFDSDTDEWPEDSGSITWYLYNGQILAQWDKDSSNKSGIKIEMQMFRGQTAARLIARSAGRKNLPACTGGWVGFIHLTVPMQGEYEGSFSYYLFPTLCNAGDCKPSAINLLNYCGVSSWSGGSPNHGLRVTGAITVSSIVNGCCKTIDAEGKAKCVKGYNLPTGECTGTPGDAPALSEIEVIDALPPGENLW